MALERSSDIRDGALHRKASEGTEREWHEDLAGRPILGVWRRRRKSRVGQMVVFEEGFLDLVQTNQEMPMRMSGGSLVQMMEGSGRARVWFVARTPWS